MSKTKKSYICKIEQKIVSIYNPRQYTKSYQPVRVNMKSYDASIIVTDHDTINYEQLVKSSKIIIDTRGRLKNKISKKIYII